MTTTVTAIQPVTTTVISTTTNTVTKTQPVTVTVTTTKRDCDDNSGHGNKQDDDKSSTDTSDSDKPKQAAESQKPSSPTADSKDEKKPPKLHPEEITVKASNERIDITAGNITEFVALPGGVRVEEIAAEYRDGILTLTVPKEAKSARREVRVRVGDGKSATTKG